MFVLDLDNLQNAVRRFARQHAKVSLTLFCLSAGILLVGQTQTTRTVAEVGAVGAASPIVIDTKNTGFVFTDPKKGQYVTFDIQGNATYLKLSWPKPGSGNAWLVYDRDGDGVIKDGTELFGNFTPHSDCDTPNFIKGKDKNGFCSLQWFDHVAQGGNGDGMLDKDDAIWKKLRLWIDTHCYLRPDVPCQSYATELHTLDSLGVHSLSLYYDGSPMKLDAMGNEFRFYAVVNPEIHDEPMDPKTGMHVGADDNRPFERSKDGRLMYAVFLRSVP